MENWLLAIWTRRCDIALALSVKGKLNHPASAQVKQAHKRDDRKAATELLVACIRPFCAVLRRVGHADTRAIDEAHDATGKQGQPSHLRSIHPPTTMKMARRVSTPKPTLA